MKTMQSVLKKWATEALDQTKDFDIEECVTLQYGDNPHWERFFLEMVFSRGWDKVRNEFRLKTTQDAQFKMIDLLNYEVEKQYAARMQATTQQERHSSMGEAI